MSNSWYALRSKAKKEDALWRQVSSLGYETFFPRLRVHPVNPRSRKWLPYFPGYFFINVDLERAGISTFQWIPHGLGLVSFGGEPATVPEPLIQSLQKRLLILAEEDRVSRTGFQPGDQIWINDGPFRGFEAIFDADLPGKERVRVLLELLGSKRKVPLELDVSKIQRKK